MFNGSRRFLEQIGHRASYYFDLSVSRLLLVQNSVFILQFCFILNTIGYPLLVFQKIIEHFSFAAYFRQWTTRTKKPYRPCGKLYLQIIVMIHAFFDILDPHKTMVLHLYQTKSAFHKHAAYQKQVNVYSQELYFLHFKLYKTLVI